MRALSTLRGGDLWNRFFSDLNGEEGGYSPEIEIDKNDREYRVIARLPGVKKENLSVTVEDGYLKISGKQEKSGKEEYESLHSEFRSYSEFHRALSIDSSNFDIDKIEASLKDGLLEVKLPLQKQAKSKQFDVKVK